MARPWSASESVEGRPHPLRSRRALSADDGAAIVEFIGLAVVMLIPLVYLVVTLAAIQGGAFAAESAARESARSAVVAGVAALERGHSQSAAEAQGEARAAAATALVMEDFGIAPGSAALELGCTGTRCLQPGSDVTASVQVAIQLPGIPGFVAAILPTTVTVGASAASPVDGLADES